MENIFISHIHEEAPLAKVFDDFLEQTSKREWNVFVSSSYDSVTLGDDWFAKIDDALNNCKVLIALCSPASMRRLWIGYEVGCAVRKGIPVFPVYHSGMSAGRLPSFLQRPQALEITVDNFADVLYNALHKQLPLSFIPKIPEQEIANALKEALQETVTVPASLPQTPSITDIIDLKDARCKRFLLKLAHSGRGHEFIPHVLGGLNIASEQWQVYLNYLEGKGLIHVYCDQSGDDYCFLTALGKNYLITEGLLEP